MPQSLVLSEVSRTAGSTRAMGTYLKFAAGAGIADWLTKLLAVRFLTDNTIPLGDHFGLALVFNTGGAGGWTYGSYTLAINVVVTTFAIVMISAIVGQLARVDRRAAWALGLVAGGATGNLVSMLVGTAGVADFLAFRFGSGSAVIANVADFMLWGGAVMLIPVVNNLLREIRREQRAKDRGMELVVRVRA